MKHGHGAAVFIGHPPEAFGKYKGLVQVGSIKFRLQHGKAVIA